MDGVGILIVEFNGLKYEYCFNNEMASKVNKKIGFNTQNTLFKGVSFSQMRCINTTINLNIYYPNWGGGLQIN